MTPKDFIDMNRKWKAHNFVVDMVHAAYNTKDGLLYVIDLNEKKSRLFDMEVSRLSSYGRKKVGNLFKITFPTINHKVRYV